MNQRKFSIRDIAQEAKVSSATVSRVFAGSAHVSAETQALVLKLRRNMVTNLKSTKNDSITSAPIVWSES